MTTYMFNAAPQHSTDAEFRAWGSGISAGLAAIGLVKTADTGQIDWSTAVKPSTANQQRGYEVWRFNDAFQSTAPVFIRVGYGSGSGAQAPAVWLTIGKGSDGAGDITGVLLAQTQHSTSSGLTSAVAYQWYLSGDGSGFCLAFAPGFFAGSGRLWVTLERSRAASGAATEVGLLYTRQTGNTPVLQTFNYAAGTAYTGQDRWPVVIPLITASDLSLAGGTTTAPLFPALVWDGVANFWQPRSILVGMRSDIGKLVPLAASDFGTYLPLGDAAVGWDSQAGAFASAAIWWQ